ncbi:MAG: hydantoinase/oxoprolinase family protein [Alphaproteobacteria bacterium]|nr:hydantoinase/oxoprolinase family protein [Alphaproteobacteria bacterium]
MAPRTSPARGRTDARLAVDIGGTFTDVVLEHGARRVTTKVLTTTRAPEEGVMKGVAEALGLAGLKPGDISLIIHGTTLATNALIERKGAKTAFITTEGFRDAIEIAYENRFEQYDLFMVRPAPLVPRRLRLTVPERMTAAGTAHLPLDEAAVAALVPTIEKNGIESVAVGYLHAYANPAHERRTRDILAARLPELSITLSSDVCPEVREYDRFSTTVANAYIQPLMARYLGRLDADLKRAGFDCPLYRMMSGGGLTTVETAIANPIRLVESGPAGGAILAAHIAAECGLSQVVSYDMGGTTAKICLIDDGVPQHSRVFEVARQYRFLKGSGLPLLIPVIEMVEIGAGGGSIARVDQLGRITVGPDSAGSEPGPACYGRGGAEPTVTDADLVMGKIDPARFAGGTIALDARSAEGAVQSGVGKPAGMAPAEAALGIAEIVDENMANAARVHAVERGKDLTGRTLIAFGGAAPLHAARLARKLGIARVVVPTGAGVGSAVGFLRAPVAYELARSRFMRLKDFDAKAVNTLLAEMRAEAMGVVRRGAPKAKLAETRTALMRYTGQGHEIVVPVPARPLSAKDADALRSAFERAYRALYDRVIPGGAVEILSWTLAVASVQARPRRAAPPRSHYTPKPQSLRGVVDPETGRLARIPVYWRSELRPGARIRGPALVAEAETTTMVTGDFDAGINALGYVELVRKGQAKKTAKKTGRSGKGA